MLFILKTLLYKHNTYNNANAYRISKINNLIHNKPCHYVSLFKDSLIFGDSNEFLYTYYPLTTSKCFLSKTTTNTALHCCTLNFISKPITIIMYKHKRSKHLIPKTIKQHNTNPYAKVEYSTILKNVATVNTNTSEGTIYNNETNTEMMSLYSINLNINEIYDYKMIEKHKDFAEDNTNVNVNDNVNDNTIAMINLEWIKCMNNKNSKSNVMTPNVCKKTYANFHNGNSNGNSNKVKAVNMKPKAKSAVKNVLKQRNNGTPNKRTQSKCNKTNNAICSNKKELFLSTICGDISNHNIRNHNNKSKSSKQSQPHAKSKLQKKIDFSLTFTPATKAKCNKSTINNNNNNNNHSTNTSTPTKSAIANENKSMFTNNNNNNGVNKKNNNDCSCNCNWNKTQTTPRLQNNDSKNIMKVNVNANGNYGNVVFKKRSFKQIKLNLNSKTSNCFQFTSNNNNNNNNNNDNSYHYYYPKKNITQNTSISTSTKKNGNSVHNRNNNIMTNKSAVLPSYKNKDKSQTSININNNYITSNKPINYFY